MSAGCCACALLVRGFAVRAVVRRPSSSDMLPSAVEIGWRGEISPDTSWPSELFRGIDAVVHLAAKVHCRGAKPQEFAAMNVQATETLLLAAARRVRRFVYCSSVHAMANFAERPLSEHDECRPTTPYGKSKRDAESAVRRLARSSGVEMVIMRPTPVYGAGLPGDLMRLLHCAGAVTRCRSDCCEGDEALSLSKTSWMLSSPPSNIPRRQAKRFL
ncbi:MAG: NAD-dependent epimerase/dehydratase family protein [Pirellulales bacterium]